MVRLGDVFDRQITGEWGNECTENETGTKILRTTNFTSEGIINYNDVVARSIREDKVIDKRLRYGDIILEKSGGTEKTPVGRVVFCDDSIEKDIYLCNNFTQAMRVRKNLAIPRYVFYFMWNLHYSGKTDLLQNKTTGIRNLQVKSYLNQNIPLPPLDEQRKIAAVLDKVSDLIAKRRQQLDKLDTLVKARFVEMFGDPVTNPMGWEKYALGTNATLLNGRAYKQDELLDSGKYPVLRVGNFFSNRGWYYSNLELDEDKYCDNGDLLYAWSASFGPQIWNGGKVIYHYHIWKVLVGEAYDKQFLCKLLDYATDSLMGGTHGIAMMHLTKSGMEETKFIIPPLELQRRFAAFVEQIDKSKLSIQKSCEKLETLKKALMQQYFG